MELLDRPAAPADPRLEAPAEPPDTTGTAVTDAAANLDIVEVEIVELSIDGMCGVY